jgi:hypothetical protein
MKSRIKKLSWIASRGAPAPALVVTLAGFPAALRAQSCGLAELGTAGELESYATAINSSKVETSPVNATNTFYKVKADYIVQL